MKKKTRVAALALTLVLGTGMSKVHTTQEEITVKNLEDTAALVLALITG